LARFVVELHPIADGGVEGEVTLESTTASQRFSSWLELLRLLEPPPTAATEEPVQGC
jgi:hypothetical protein